ncbi:MAG: dihydroorotate dehydrogenase PyrD [Desulfurococcaceae archaeon]
MNTSLETSIGGVRLSHPVMNASGILGSEPEHVNILVEAGFSAIVTKTFTLEPREGYPPPILVKLESGGYLNAVGLANRGARYIPLLVERAKACGKPIVVSIGGRNAKEFTELAIIVEEAGATAVELNLSCPHVKGHGLDLGSDPSLVYELVKEVASAIKIPVIVKLGLSDRVVDSSGRALEAGAKALTLINAIRAMAIDVYSAKPVLSNRQGGLSGPPIKPIAVRVVFDVYREYKAEIVGCGGISSWKDAAEFILAGAKAVQVGSALLGNRNVANEIVKGLESWTSLLGYSRLAELVGMAHKD